MRLSPNRRLLIVVLAIAAGVVCAAAATRWRSGAGLRRFAYNIQPLAPMDYAALCVHSGWRAATLQPERGVMLRGLERIPVQPGAPFVIFFTGNEGHPLEQGQRFLDALRGAHDWGAAVWAYRGFDGSGGAPDPDALLADGWRAYTRLTNDEAIAPGRIHLVGFSLGTSIVAAIAARSASEPPASITLLGPLTEIEMTFLRSLARHRYQTLKYLDAVTAPALVIHGHRDAVLPVEWGRLIAARLGARARYVEPPELGHLDLPMSPVVLDEVRTFIEQRSR